MKPLDPRFSLELTRLGLMPFALLINGAHQGDNRGRTPLPKLLPALLSGLVDRWRPETHTFHLPFGEMTITLKDVSMLLGLPIHGGPLGMGKPETAEWMNYCEDR